MKLSIFTDGKVNQAYDVIPLLYDSNDARETARRIAHNVSKLMPKAIFRLELENRIEDYQNGYLMYATFPDIEKEV